MLAFLNPIAMSTILINRRPTQLNSINNIPEIFKPYFTKKPFGSNWHYSGDCGEILFNNIYTGDTQIWFRYFHIKQPCQIRLYQKKSLLGLFLALKNNLNLIFHDAIWLECNERCYNFVYLPGYSLDLDFKMVGTYITFESVAINNPQEWLKQYPIINQTLPLQSTLPYILFPYSPKITRYQQNIINELQQTLAEKAALEAQLHIKLSAIFTMFLETGLPKISKLKVELWYIAQIEAARNFIKEHYEIHYNIPDLSRQFGMSETAFKQSFKRITSYTPLEYLLKIRKEKVIEFLQKGVTLKDAVLMVGYETERGFRKAFNLNASDFLQMPGSDKELNDQTDL